MDTSASPQDARRFIRHPSSIPLHCTRRGHVNASIHELRNMSYGGLSFVSGEAYAPGDLVDIGFPNLRHEALVHGEVVWSTELDEGSPKKYLNGLRFQDEGDHFHARLIEQICHIESYRRAQEMHYGRKIDPHVAAEEWIAKHASSFPS